MKKNTSLKNKYTLLLSMLLLLLVLDVFLHKGMTRVLMPAGFSNTIQPQLLQPTSKALIITAKEWKKAVNSLAVMQGLPSDLAGFEMDVYFDTAKNSFQVYHDSAVFSSQSLEGLLEMYQQRKLTSSIWLDFKNLSNRNEKQSLLYLSDLREKFALQQKIIVESTEPQYLQSFNDKGFFTSYYTPYFNPYSISVNDLHVFVDSITATLKKYNVSALSGYYFQMPALKRYFPSYPLLSWADSDRFSFVSFLFHRKLQREPALNVLLFP